MKQLKTLTDVYGPFSTVERTEDDNGWFCDRNPSDSSKGMIFPDGVIGEATVETYVAPVVIPVKVVPVKVSMRQARLALHGAGLLDDIETIITILGATAKIEWDYSTEVQRKHPLIAAVQAQNQMTNDQIDDLFILAATL